MIDSTIVVESIIFAKGDEVTDMEKNLTSGSVFKNIIYFSLPYFLSYFLQTLYGMADLFIIGQYNGVDSTTAVSIGSQVMHMLTVMIVGLAMGTTVTIARAIGANDKKHASVYIGNTVILFMSLSVILTAVLLLLVKPIVSVMSTPAEAVEGTIRYLTICFIGIPCITAYNIISSIYRGLGDSKTPMYFIGATCAFNIALDYLFIGHFDMGPAGAALGTTLAQAASVVIAAVTMKFSKNGIPASRDSFKIHWSEMRQILGIGVPVALQDGFIQVAFIVITIIANNRGLNDAAAVGIVEKIIGFLFLVPSSMLSTVSALCAQNIGAGKHDRATKTLRYAIAIAMSFGLVVSVVIQFVSEPVVGLFTNDANVIYLGGQYIRGYIFDCFFAGAQFCFSGYFCAYGKSGFSFLHNVLSVTLVRVPGAYLTSKFFPGTLLPMGLASAAGSVFSTVVCLIIFMIMRRQFRKDEETDRVST